MDVHNCWNTPSLGRFEEWVSSWHEFRNSFFRAQAFILRMNMTSDDSMRRSFTRRSNFEVFYNGNRAPFPVFLHEAWLKDAHRKEGYLRFVDWLLQKRDVHIVTINEVVEFMKNPQELTSYKQHRCTTTKAQTTCVANSCVYDDTPLNGQRIMHTCSKCPPKYPWVGNPLGN